MATLAEGLAANGLALLSDPRETLEPELPRLAGEHGLDWQCQRRANYTLVRVRRLEGAHALDLPAGARQDSYYLYRAP
jgi:hypothetical protein